MIVWKEREREREVGLTNLPLFPSHKVILLPDPFFSLLLYRKLKGTCQSNFQLVLLVPVLE